MPQRRYAFTLVELLVVVAIIIAVIALISPGIKSIIGGSQRTQAENAVRSTLIATRAYAITNACLAGVRFQTDGRMVMVYAHNQSESFSADSFRTPPTYRMRAVADVQPNMLPGLFRVVASDGLKSSLWQSNPNLFTGEKWYGTCAVLFSSRGRLIQADCVFPADWFPTSSGCFGLWTGSVSAGVPSGTVYSHQGNIGLFASGEGPRNTPATGPCVATEFRIYDHGAARGPLQDAAQTLTSRTYTTYAGTFTYEYWQPNAAMDLGLQAINQTGVSFVVDVNTGMMIRLSPGTAIQQ